MSETPSFDQAESPIISEETEQKNKIQVLFKNIPLSSEDIQILMTQFEDIQKLSQQNTTQYIADIQENLPLDLVKVQKIIKNIIKKEKTETWKEKTETTSIETVKWKEKTETKNDLLEKQKAVLERWEQIAKDINLIGLKWYDAIAEKAREEVLSQKPKLWEEQNQQELEKQTQACILAFHQKELYDNNPWLEEKYGEVLKEFETQTIKSWIFVKEKEKYQPNFHAFWVKPWILKSEIWEAQALFVPDGKPVKIEGNSFISWGEKEDEVKQIITIDEKWVRKSISKYGYTIEVKKSIVFKPEIKKELQTINESLESKYKKIDQNYTLFKQLPKEPNMDQISIQQLKNNKNIPEKIQWNLQSLEQVKKDIAEKSNYQWENKETNDLLIEELKKQETELQEKIVEQFKKLFEETQWAEEEIEIWEKKQNELMKIDEENMVENQESQQKADEKIVETLDFLDLLWLTNISQENLEEIIKRVNIEPNNFGLSKKINLEEWFETQELDAHKFKRELLKLFQPMYTQMGITINQEFLLAGHKNPDITNTTEFRGKLSEVWVKEWVLNINTFIEMLKKKEKNEGGE